MNPLAELVMSAPSDIARTMENPDVILPLAIKLIWLRRLYPFSMLSAKVRPSSKGNPTVLENSGGAAPVP